MSQNSHFLEYRTGRSKMPIFNQEIMHNDEIQKNQHIQIIIKNIISLSKATLEGKFTAQICWKIFDSLKTKANSQAIEPCSEITIILNILENISQQDDIIIDKDESLIKCLKWFEEEHGDHFDLSQLCIQSPTFTEEQLKQFALFYLLFIQHITYNAEAKTAICDLPKIKDECQKWQNGRKRSVANNSLVQIGHQRYSGLTAKFEAEGHVSPHEWLTDWDIKKAFQFLGLSQFDASICGNTIDIGMTLHFQRIAHENDNPKRPYAIPIIFNQNSAHWTRILIIVTPQDNNEPRISVKYTDTVGRSPNKNNEKMIRQALNYHEKSTNRDTNTVVHFTAFPNAIIETPIRIEGTNEQRDSYSCGYRALQGLLRDLNEASFLNDPLTPTQEAYLACTTSDQLRDFIFQQFKVDIPAEISPMMHYAPLSREKIIPSQQAQPIKNSALTEKSFGNYVNHLYKQWPTHHEEHPQKDSSLTSKTKALMGNLLFLQYKTYRSGNASLSEFTTLQRVTQRLIQNVNKLENKDLSKSLLEAIKDSHHEHILQLTNHWTDHEEMKSNYLSNSMIELYNIGVNKIVAWKSDENFKIWWDDKKDPKVSVSMKSQIKHWLTKYKKPQWIFNISVDRKNIAEKILREIESIDDATPEAILAIIYVSQKNILESDWFRDRTITKSFQDPLYQFLNQLQARVYSMMPPKKMDQTIQHELKMIKITLQTFYRYTPLQELRELIENINIESPLTSYAEIEAQYTSISNFFETQINASLNKELAKDKNLSAMLVYWKQKQKTLPTYFKQCDEFSSIANNLQICPKLKKAPSLWKRFYGWLCHVADVIRDAFLFDDSPIPTTPEKRIVVKPVAPKKPADQPKKTPEPLKKCEKPLKKSQLDNTKTTEQTTTPLKEDKLFYNFFFNHPKSPKQIEMKTPSQKLEAPSEATSLFKETQIDKAIEFAAHSK